MMIFGSAAALMDLFRLLPFRWGCAIFESSYLEPNSLPARRLRLFESLLSSAGSDIAFLADDLDRFFDAAPRMTSLSMMASISRR